jgi:hypothetical protein
MTIRKPLILTSGVVENLQASDQLANLRISMFGGRLTGVSNGPVSDIGGTSTLYYTPYLHGYVFLKIGGAWQRKAFTQISSSIPTVGGPDDKQLYDVFLYDNSGTLAMEFVQWTNRTTRATSVVADTDTRILTKNGDATRAYVGTMGASISSQSTSDFAGTRWIYNFYNQVRKPFYTNFAGAGNWTVTNRSTYAMVKGSTAPTLSFVYGMGGPRPEFHIQVRCYISAGSTGTASIGLAIGPNASTTTVSAPSIIGVNATTTEQTIMAHDNVTTPTVGLNDVNWLEAGPSSGTATFLGTSALPDNGIFGSIDI